MRVVELDEELSSIPTADAISLADAAAAQRRGACEFEAGLGGMADSGGYGIPVGHGLQIDGITKMLLELRFQFIAAWNMVLPAAAGDLDRAEQ